MKVAVLHTDIMNRGVCLRQGFAQGRGRGRLRGFVEDVGQGIDGRLAGQFSHLMPPHAIGDGK